MGNIGPMELLLILVIALVVFGPGKLPDIAKGLGKAVNEFKEASKSSPKDDRLDLTKSDAHSASTQAVQDEPTVQESPNEPGKEGK